MAAFSHQSFLHDQTIFFPNPAACFPHDHDHTFHGFYEDQPCVANKLQSPDTSMSVVLDDQKVESGNELLAKKRKDKQVVSYHVQSKDTNKRLKKQKKTNDYQEEKKKKNTKNGPCEEEGEIGYIHVRAKRGQATDSHSLAERVRREKISERMKLLQAIVPGCDKVTGKALMLDEIINYVQSLQNQVEFLSMKLASVNPTLYDFGVDLDAFMLKPDHENNMSNMVLPIMPNVQQCSLNDGGATFAPMNDNYNYLSQLINGSVTTNGSQLFQQAQLSQGNGHQLWDVDEQRLKLDNSFALTNNVLTSFH
ncbi:hypothetical protein QVD17_25506 [Tagetes erecta]|uniref:BHLH domain-containing protein n=1 Tax=Tagetes erecta TaxID=13708 RepID=A0AAD8KJ33_TARER|nr:hypothetical protein QVD17_25506 [Tagetes erecta]